MLIEKSTAFYLLSYYYEIKYNTSFNVYSTSNLRNVNCIEPFVLLVVEACVSLGNIEINKVSVENEKGYN